MAKAPERHTKTAREKKSLVLDCGGLLQRGETITSIDSVSISPAGLTISDQQVNSEPIEEPGKRTIPAGEGITCYASAGESGEAYDVTFQFTTSSGQDLDAVIEHRVT